MILALVSSACGSDVRTDAGGSGTAVAPGDGDGNGGSDAGGGNGNGGIAPGEDQAGAPVGTWLLRSGTVDGEALVLVDGHDATLTIDDDGTIGGTAACNGYGGTATIAEGRFHLDEYAITEMGCPGDLMVLESAFMAGLGSATGYEVTGGTLLLSGDDVELTFEPVPDLPTAELVGTDWTLDTLIDGDAASSVQGDAVLRLNEDGTFFASTGCRLVSGTWLIAGERLRFPTMSAEGVCDPDLTAQDSFVIGALEGPATVVIDGPTMTLTSPGNVGLRYRSDLG